MLCMILISWNYYSMLYGYRSWSDFCMFTTLFQIKHHYGGIAMPVKFSEDLWGGGPRTWQCAPPMADKQSSLPRHTAHNRDYDHYSITQYWCFLRGFHVLDCVLDLHRDLPWFSCRNLDVEFHRCGSQELATSDSNRGCLGKSTHQ